MRWYVVHAYSGYEKKVAAALQERVCFMVWKTSLVSILVPTEEVVEIGVVKSAKVSASFSPVMYWFRWSWVMITWHLVKETPRVYGLYWWQGR